VIPVTEDATVIVIPMDGISTFPDGRTVRDADAPDETALLLREGADQPWRLEVADVPVSGGPSTAPPSAPPSGGGLVDGNGVQWTMSIPEGGHAWYFVDGALHADSQWVGPDHWSVPPVAPTSPTTSFGRQIVTVFTGNMSRPPGSSPSAAHAAKCARKYRTPPAADLRAVPVRLDEVSRSADGKFPDSASGTGPSTWPGGGQRASTTQGTP
jgi:hypothetical protein